jgi:putative ABC transport system permease protein
MNVPESIRISWRSITGHKLRSTLTTLGIILGIGAVIVFMVLGGAFEANILQDVDQENAPIMTVQTQTSPDGGFGFQTLESPIYTQSDVDAVRNISGVEYVAPDGTIPSSQLKANESRLTGGFTTQATSAERFDADLWTMSEGRIFEARDEAVLNDALVSALDGEIGIDDQVTIRFDDGRQLNFTVTGIVENDAGGFSLPTIYVPLEHYNNTIQTPDGSEERAYSSLVVGAESLQQLKGVQDRVIEYFETDSDAQQLKQEDHQIQVQTVQDLLDQVSNIIGQLTLFIAGIAGISLLVGSIGIANIMIVSVTERTKEIGIMKAVGAKKRDIIQLFLVESLILGIIGAIFGVIVGLGFGYLLVAYFGWPMVYPLNWIVIAVAVGVLVGILSGVYPAWRAR